MKQKTINYIIVKKEKIDTLNQEIGLNSNIITYLIAHPLTYKKQYQRIFTNEGLFYVHELSLKPEIEVQKVLIRDYNYKKKEAKEALKSYLKKKNIETIPINKEKRRLAEERERLCNKNGIPIHPPDSIIISDFIEHGITKAFSEDGTFIKACNFLGLSSEQILFKFDKEIQKELGNLKPFKIK